MHYRFEGLAQMCVVCARSCVCVYPCVCVCVCVVYLCMLHLGFALPLKEWHRCVLRVCVCVYLYLRVCGVSVCPAPLLVLSL